MSAPGDPFAPLWVAVAAFLARPGAFDWSAAGVPAPAPRTPHEHAARGHTIGVHSPLSADTAIVVGLEDPHWQDHDVVDDDGSELPSSTVDVWPELRPHLARDGRLRAVATVGPSVENPQQRERHQVRLVDLETLTLGPAVTVQAFGGSK